jgi:hypothetical protein
VGKVRAIKRGLMVAPPKRSFSKGKVKERLFTQYALRTGRQQRASVGFVDGSILHINQLTDAVLVSVQATRVNKGEVDQIVVPGTHHDITTPVATASAIGTEFDTRCASKKVCVFTVVEGAVLVTSKTGASVTVTTGEQSTVKKGKAPTPPKPVDAPTTVAWTRSLPPAPPEVGENVSLAANGGTVRASSTRQSPSGLWDASHITDGDTSTGWQSAQGAVSNVILTFTLGQGGPRHVTGIVIDPAAVGGEDPSNDLKDFTVRASLNGSSFVTESTGQTAQSNTLQRFTFPKPFDATSIQLILQDNWGGKDGIAVSEVEIVADRSAPSGAAATSTPTPQTTPTPTPKPTATRPAPTPTRPAPTATATKVPSFLWKVNVTTNSYNYQSPGSDPSTEFDQLAAQSCGPDPSTNGWSGTVTEVYTDLTTNQTQNEALPFSGVTLPQGTQERLYTFAPNPDGSPAGHADAEILPGSSPQMEFFFSGDPENNPQPPTVQGTSNIVNAGSC